LRKESGKSASHSFVNKSLTNTLIKKKVRGILRVDCQGCCIAKVPFPLASRTGSAVIECDKSKPVSMRGSDIEGAYSMR
jgi:hypothetical protein